VTKVEEKLHETSLRFSQCLPASAPSEQQSPKPSFHQKKPSHVIFDQEKFFEPEDLEALEDDVRSNDLNNLVEDPLNEPYNQFIENAERLQDEEERSDLTIEYEESSKSAEGEESDSSSEVRRMITEDMEQPDDTVHSSNDDEMIHNIFGGGKA
jgi:hypothetical protein